MVHALYKSTMRPRLCRVSTPRILLAACLAVLAQSFAFSGSVVREPGVIYLEDFAAHPVKIPVKEDASIYYQPDLARYLGTLKKGQFVELQAVAQGAYRVRGLAQQGQVAGWVAPGSLPALKKEFLEGLKQNAQRHEEVATLISHNEVAVNMTPDEVVASLGKPSRKSSRQDGNGREEVWEFIKYERVPQETTGYDRFGRLVSSVVYVKVPAGKVSVVFDNNLVTSLEQTEGSLERDARPRLVAPPPLVLNN